LPLYRCGLCGEEVHFDCSERSYTKKLKRLLAYLNSPECGLCGESADKDYAQVDITQFQHFCHLYGGYEEAMTQLRKFNNTGKVFNDFKALLKSLHRYTDVMKAFRKVKRVGLRAIGKLRMKNDSSFGKKRTQRKESATLEMILAQLNPLVDMSEQDMSFAELDVVKEYRGRGRRYRCSHCGHFMRRIKPEEVEAIVAYLNSEDCKLLADESGELKVSTPELEHLFHQEESLERVLAHLRALDKAGKRFTTFSQLVPAIHRRLKITGVVMKAVNKFKMKLRLARQRRVMATVEAANKS
jgi:hypothetical protein